MVVWLWPPMARKMVVTGGVFVFSISCFGLGAYFSFINTGPQQERMKARREAMRNYLKKQLGD